MGSGLESAGQGIVLVFFVLPVLFKVGIEALFALAGFGRFAGLLADLAAAAFVAWGCWYCATQPVSLPFAAALYYPLLKLAGLLRAR